jgi:hypothetical protein
MDESERMLLQSILASQRDGFDNLKHLMAVHASRLEVLATTLTQHGESIVRLDSRVTNLDKEVFDRPHRRHDDPPPIVPLNDWRRILAGVGVLGLAFWAGVQVLFTIGDWLHKVGAR